MSTVARTGAAAGAMALLLLAACGGSAAPPQQPERPDLSGFWMLTRTVEDEVLKSRLDPEAVVLQDTGAPEYGPLDFGGLQLTPQAEAAALLDISVEALESLLARARRALRQTLAPMGELQP